MNTDYNDDYYNTIEQLALLSLWAYEEEYNAAHYINYKSQFLTEYTDLFLNLRNRLISLGYDKNRIDYDVANFDYGKGCIM